MTFETADEFEMTEAFPWATDELNVHEWSLDQTIHQSLRARDDARYTDNAMQPRRRRRPAMTHEHPRSLDDVATLARSSLPDHATEDDVVTRMMELASLAEIQRWMEDQILAVVRQVLAEQGAFVLADRQLGLFEQGYDRTTHETAPTGDECPPANSFSTSMNPSSRP